MTPRPFLRWAGGKGWIADILAEEIAATQPITYCEPFLGAGAVALALPHGDRSPKLVLGDFSSPLMNLWRGVATYPRQVADLAKAIYTEYGNRQDGYLAVRAQFNQYGGSNGLYAAARMLYLNAISFNGLWRENKHGYYNVPFGDVKSPRIAGFDQLEAVAGYLQGRSTLLSGSFEETIQAAMPFGDASSLAVFADPPYDKGYTSYVAGGFGEGLQRQLAINLREVVDRGGRIWTTNSDTPLIREIYSWADIAPLSEPRAISAKASTRKAANCLLIRGGH